MNVKELIEKYKRYEKKWNGKTGELARQIFIEDLKQLDEPQPVKVPQFVADWLEKCKNEEKSLLKSLLYTPAGVNSWVESSENQETFARAWIFGYEVEKEKLVKVRLKGIGQYLCNDETGLHFQHGFKTDFTKDDLEKLDFGWVFDCPGIEIEEVE